MEHTVRNGEEEGHEWEIETIGNKKTWQCKECFHNTVS